MTAPIAPRPTWSCAQLAAACQVRDDTVWRWCRTRTIVATKIGKCYYIPADEAERIIRGPRLGMAKA